MALDLSSLSRYRSAILAVTAIAAGCTIFYIQNARWPSSSPVPPTPRRAGLHRSNAQRRRHRDGHAGQTDGPSSEADEVEGQRPIGTSAGVPTPAMLAHHGEPTAGDTFSVEATAVEEMTTRVDTDSLSSWSGEILSDAEDQNRLNLLYRIAKEQETKEGYLHRGISCSSCSQLPIRGIRYRCANCVDYDLCEQCEATQPHTRTHLFYKIRVPVPFLGSPRQPPQPVWYPGTPHHGAQHLPLDLVKLHGQETDFQTSEVEALWDQFTCLAAPVMEDPNHFDLAIDRQTFDKCFSPNHTVRSTASNLVYDRMFHFYDADRDGLIAFHEFLSGISCLTKPSRAHERLRRMFEGYDMDENGWVDRKDFLRIFRAYYAISRELTKEIVTAWDNEDADSGGSRQLLAGSQPISSAFRDHIPAGERPRTGEGKRRDEDGDYVIDDGASILRESQGGQADHNEVLADVVEMRIFGNHGDEDFKKLEESMLAEEVTTDDWPPQYVRMEDVVMALNHTAPLDDIRDPGERESIRQVAIQRITERNQKRQAVRQSGVQQRWERQQFFLDEEDGALPPQGFEHRERTGAALSPRRSRSSSKVRLQDDLMTGEEQQSRSATSMSSRSVALAERWGEYEVPEAEKDVGRDVIYQVTQEALNELLDPLFEQREDFAIAARRTRLERQEIRHFLDEVGVNETLIWIKKAFHEYQKDVRMRGRISASSYVIEPLRSILSFVKNSDPMEQEVLRPEYKPSNEGESAVRTPGNSAAALEARTSSDLNENPQGSPCSSFSSDISPDPTLPHNRADSVPAQATSPVDASSSKKNRVSSRRPFGFPVPRPTPGRLLFLLAMDYIDEDDQKRGGPGRLSFDEFKEVFTGTEGPSMGFLGAWLDMAVF